MTRSKHDLPPIAPVCVSQLTSIAILGIDPRRFLEAVAPKCHGVAHVGRLRLVPIDEAVRVLRSLAIEDDADGDANDTTGDATQAADADAFLASVGRRRIGGSR